MKMDKEHLIDELETVRDQLNDMDRRIEDLLGDLNDEEEAEEVDAPVSEFHVGDILDFACVNKDGRMEFLTGTVTEVSEHDEHGFYDRVVTPDGRKFRVPVNSTDTRLGTRVLRVHDR